MMTTMADAAATAPSPFKREPLQLVTIKAIKVAVATASSATVSRRLLDTTLQGYACHALGSLLIP